MLSFRAFSGSYFLLALSLLSGMPRLSAQADYRLTLPEVVALARSESPDAELAQTRLNNNYWRFRSFQADFKPQITLDATLPNLNRSIENITLPDGTENFISRSLMRNSVGLSLAQPLAFSGGQVFLFSGLRRLDVFSQTSGTIISYLSTPVSIGFVQPFWSYNALKWSKRIEPLRYEESQRRYHEELEGAGTAAAGNFFDLLIAQLNLEAARNNQANADTLFELSQGRFGVGRIAETDLLQIELSVMNADAALARATLAQQTANEELRRFLGITRDVRFELVPPSLIPDLRIDAERALELALANRSEIIAYERRRVEAESELEQAQRQNGFQLNLEGQFGLSQTGKSLSDAYTEPLDQEVVTLGVQVPIADFGKARSRIEVARSNLELEVMNLEQERVSFERRVLLAVQQYDLLRNQVRLAERAYEVARRREEMTRKRYLIGKIGITELNLAVGDMDTNRVGYFSALRDFWNGHYELRRLTLYDFLNDRPLE